MTVDYTRMPPQSGRPPSTPEKKSSGCLKWFGIGCAVLTVLALAGVAGLFLFVFNLIRSNEVYKEALHRAQTNPQVIALLGQPIEAGWWVTGNVKIGDDSGVARFTFPIHGPKGEASVTANATKEGGHWTYTRLTVQPEHGREIDLLR